MRTSFARCTVRRTNSREALSVVSLFRSACLHYFSETSSSDLEEEERRRRRSRIYCISSYWRRASERANGRIGRLDWRARRERRALTRLGPSLLLSQALKSEMNTNGMARTTHVEKKRKSFLSFFLFPPPSKVVSQPSSRTLVFHVRARFWLLSLEDGLCFLARSLASSDWRHKFEYGALVSNVQYSRIKSCTAREPRFHFKLGFYARSFFFFSSSLPLTRRLRRRRTKRIGAFFSGDRG